MILRNVEVEGRVVDVRFEAGRIAEVGEHLRGRDELDGQGGALIPGLCDHHIHLFGLAAQADSVTLDGATGSGEFARRIRAAVADRPPGAWIRATGYDEAMAGEVTRADLDALAPAHRLRVQHRTGAVWILNSAALAALGDETPANLDRASGRLFRGDDWLRGRLPRNPPPLAPVGARLAAYGITHLTDASVTTEASAASRLAAGELPQRLTLMSAGPLPSDERYAVGAVKVLLDDHDLIDLDDFTARIAAARVQGRKVAVHCVTAAELALTLAAFEIAGAEPGDRIEHGGLIPESAIPQLRALRLTVVTQPGFVRERGDRYLAEVDPAEQPDLYRCASLRAAGVPVAASSDAPYASPDPWAAMAAAADRRTGSGQALGPAERVDPATALTMYLTDPSDPGGPPRRVAVCAPADLCLLKVPLRQALAELSAELVRTTLIGGRIVG